MLNILDLACHAGCPYIQLAAHAQQVVGSFQEELIKWDYSWPIPQNGAKKVSSLFQILTFILNLHFERGMWARNASHFVRTEFILLRNGPTWSWIAVLVIEILTICHSNTLLGLENREISENADIGGSIRPPENGCTVLQLILLHESHISSACVKVFNSRLLALRVTNLSSTPSPSSFLLYLHHALYFGFWHSMWI